MYRFPFLEVLESREPRRILELRRQLAGLLQHFRPDLVHAFYASYSSFFLESALPASVPAVLTLHDTYPDLALRPDSALGSLLYRADWVTTCSPAVLRRTIGQVPSIAARASAITNALPLPDLAPTPVSVDPPRLLCLGRVVPAKGFDIALRAFVLIHARFPTARLAIAGDGHALGALRELARDLAVAPWVDFLGWIEPPEVPALIAAASVVLMPSTGFEPFGLVALQAAQMGRPIVASRIGGLQDVVLEGETGLLSEPGDAAGLAAATCSLLSNRLLATLMSLAAYEYARTEYRWERHVEEYVDLYTRLLHRPSYPDAKGPG